MSVTDMSKEQLDATATNSALSRDVGLYPGMKVRHVKTGRVYFVVCEALIEATMTKAVVYRSTSDGSVWVRPAFEFCDGRFVGI